ncbi:serine/threonine protein kinase, putative [Beauveria bassiana ARSEF 2860]|uniref:non-specific serine/threonine protein kinase n=1 Tax=Beauveria bassiana (strain ARSEF 2860) TaxID=655819 RepID=J5K8U0_BEAB2|nr:serine/threonine protein kinase, putative [Beauveria bassiana ARSEF 2860]EJP70541.1 serine/threonine protein kinase, putative [Beauveria bassiana ARSEF 2860]
MAQILQDLIYSLGNCLSCFPGSPTLKVNSRSFKILQLLGEGGFSYVYLVQDLSTKEHFALKKIRCPFGAESVQQAMREVEAYRLFQHVPNIISAIDHTVATERGGGGAAADEAANKTVYVLLPYYRRGNLQDMINANLVNHARFPERHLMALFLGVCRALRAMHDHHAPPAERMEMGHEADNDPGPSGSSSGSRSRGGGARSSTKRTEEDEETEQERPLMEAENQIGQGGKIKSYAHRDIKPGNIMIDDSGSNPILMDLGSVAPSPMPVTSQSVALQIQETAAEHSTMPYRAPELFDVQTGTVIDTKVDIWSLGCTLFACLVGKSPFEMRSDETGGTLSLCVMGGDWRFPDQSPNGARRVNSIQVAKAKAAAGAPGAAGATGAGEGSSSGEAVISEPIREIVRACLKVEPAERPDIHQLITMVENVIQNLPGGDANS